MEPKFAKQILSVLISAGIASTMLPSSIVSANEEIEESAVAEDAAEEKNVTAVLATETASWASGDTTVTLYDDGSLVVSGTGAMDDYGTSTKTRAPWLASSTYYSAIKSLTIEEGVTHIGACILYSSTTYKATNLESVSIASTVTSIGDRFLQYCSGVTSITIPDSVTSIGTYFLANYTGSGLSVTIPDSVTSIGGNAFYNSTGITSVTLGNGVTTIESSFLYGCTGITSFTLPESVTEIGSSFLQGCTGITSFTLPITVTSVGANFMQNCTSLASLTIEVNEEGNAGFDTINGSFLSGCSALTEVTIPNNITSVGNSFLYGCSSLTSVTIPDSITSKGTAFLRNCTGLDTAIIGSGITSLANYDFSGDENISIYFLGSISSIASGYSFGRGTTSYPYTTGTAYVFDQTSYDTISSADAVTNEYLTVVNLAEIYEYINNNLVPVIEEGDPLVEVDYTADSWAVFETTYENAVDFVDDITSYSTYTTSDVDTLVSALTSALDGLVLADSSDATTELKETYENINTLLTVKDESDYTEDSWTALQTAIANAKAVLDDIEANSTDYKNSVLNALTTAITSAYDNLEVDTTIVTEIITKTYDVTDGGIYYDVTASNLTTLQTITATSDDIAGATSVTITFDCASDTSYNPYASIDFTITINGTEYYERFTGTDSNYAGGSTGWTETIELDSPIEADDVVTITGATASWASAGSYVYNVTQIAYQIESTSANYDTATDEELTAAIADAQAVLDSLVDGDYTEESVYLLTEIIAEAQAVLADDSATDAQNAVEIDELAAAVAALTMTDTTEATAALEELLAEAKAYSAEDYTEDSYSVLAAAIAAAEALDSTSTNSEILAAADALQAAIDALEEVDNNTSSNTSSSSSSVDDSSSTTDDSSSTADDSSSTNDTSSVDDTSSTEDSSSDTDSTEDSEEDSEEDSDEDSDEDEDSADDEDSDEDSASDATSSSTTTTASTSTASDNSPDTGVAATGIAATLLAAATIVVTRRKKK